MVWNEEFDSVCPCRPFALSSSFFAARFDVERLNPSPLPLGLPFMVPLAEIGVGKVPELVLDASS